MASAEDPYSDLIAAVRRAAPRAVALRRSLHRIPEPSGRERKTAASVAAELEKTGEHARTGVAGTGVTADLDAGRPGPYVLLRADMDALPLEDRSPAEHRSQHPGYSHACGHDGHMAILVGVAHVLKELRARLTGRVRFVFQPAEECANGAKAMLAAGLLADGRPDAVLALHGWPGLPPDTVASRAGVVGASNDVFTIHVQGRGGHSARPHEARNPLDGMARLLQALPALSTTERVVTISMVRAGASHNVIPDEGTLTGTARALDEALRRRTRNEICRQAEALCTPLGLSAKVSFREGCPPVVNDASLFLELRALGDRLDPHLRVRELEAASMGAEDFAFFTEQAPGLLVRLGVGVDAPPLHTPQFAFNDEAVPTGMLALAGMVVRICAPRAEGR